MTVDVTTEKFDLPLLTSGEFGQKKETNLGGKNLE